MGKSKKNKIEHVLCKVSCPDDVKALSKKEIPVLAREIREFLIQNAKTNGGHLASNLGVVELSIALHRVFDTPFDHIIFDVGHQSYVHKILTGRKELFGTLRRPGGLSGFTLRGESEHDCFGAGHSSTSVSAALGFAEADKLNGSDAYTVAVLGDGAFTGGMVHEALNNCSKDLKLIIVLNENEMSISRNIGRFARSLASLRTTPAYFRTKRNAGKIIKKIPLLGKPLFNAVRDVKKSLKNLIYGSNYFEDLGLYYIGPIDGNNEEKVEIALSEAKKLNESAVIHIKTKKGKGYPDAENNPRLYHSLKPGGFPNSDSMPENLPCICGEYVSEKAKTDKNILAVTAAMSYGTGFEVFRAEHPERFFDVGIAEGHALTFSAGLAAAGKRPVVAIYSTFLQRGVDSIIHDIALQNLPVLICVDRAGLNRYDGTTHNGVFDVALFSAIKNIRVYTPACRKALKRAIDFCLGLDAPSVIRYPQDSDKPRITEEFYTEENGSDDVKIQKKIPDDTGVVIISHGGMVARALDASAILNKKKIPSAVIMLERIMPYDEIAGYVKKILPKNTKYIFTLEEEVRAGGMGIMLRDALERAGIDGIRADGFALEEPFGSRRSDTDIYESFGLDAETVASKIRDIVKKGGGIF